MQEMNYRYEVGKESPEIVAYDFLSELDLVSKAPGVTAKHPVIRQTLEHIRLTFLATFLAILIAVPSAIFITHQDRKSTRLNSSHVATSYAVFCLKKKNRHV